MRVEVRLFATLRLGRFKHRCMEYPDHTLLTTILADLGIVEADVGVLLVNGRHADQDTPLADNDVIAVFPGIGGG